MSRDVTLTIPVEKFWLNPTFLARAHSYGLGRLIGDDFVALNSSRQYWMTNWWRWQNALHYVIVDYSDQMTN